MNPGDAENLAGPRVFGVDLGRAKAGLGPMQGGPAGYLAGVQLVA